MSATIDGRVIGDDRPCFVIAEAGVNHNGDLGLALQLVEAARAAGADAVKFQTFVADELVSPMAAKADYQRRADLPSESQLEMLRRLELDEASFERVRDHARSSGLVFLSSPFDDGSLDVVVRLGVPAIKLGSGELTNLPLLARAARTGLPLIVSTGMATLEEVGTAVATVRSHHADLVLLHCVSQYPAEPATSNLRAMRTMSEAFGVPVGFSDHSVGNAVAAAAVALGACVLERHLTIDTELPGPDHAASLDPDAFRAFVQDVRTVEAALGDGRKVPTEAEVELARVARKSIVARRDLEPGVALTADDLAIRRPGSGLPPAMLNELLGRRLARRLPAGSPLTADALA